MTKIFSSRISEDSITERLQGISYIVNDVAEIDEDLAITTETLLSQLEHNILKLASDYEELKQERSALYSDVLTLTANVVSLSHHLQKCTEILSHLSNLPDSEELIDRAVETAVVLGRATVTNIPVEIEDDDESPYDVKIEFGEEGLRNGLIAAIAQYNNLLSAKILKSFRNP